jgi:hypothetical protein
VELGAPPAYAGAQRRSPASAAFVLPASCIEILVLEVWLSWSELRAKRATAPARIARHAPAALRITSPQTISSSGGKVQNALARR